jgi:signal transduction histidine kinase
MQGLPPIEWLAPSQALQVIRIVQEILTNILKHAAATRVRISTSYSTDQIEVRIYDNGCGFDAGAAMKNCGRGLRHLPKRAASLRGSLLIDSMPGNGTTVRLLLPLTFESTGVAAAV